MINVSNISTLNYIVSETDLFYINNEVYKYTNIIKGFYKQKLIAIFILMSIALFCYYFGGWLDYKKFIPIKYTDKAMKICMVVSNALVLTLIFVDFEIYIQR